MFNFPVPVHDFGDYAVLAVSNIDVLERLARDDPHAAGQAALEEAASKRTHSATPKWMTEMAEALRDDCVKGRRTNLARLATELDISPQHASRAFAENYGASPGRFRNEHRLRKALSLLRAGRATSEAAYESGFADQSHMTRAMTRFIGQTPGQWRAAARR